MAQANRSLLKELKRAYRLQIDGEQAAFDLAIATIAAQWCEDFEKMRESLDKLSRRFPK